MVGAWCIEGRQSNHHQPIAQLAQRRAWRSDTPAVAPFTCGTRIGIVYPSALLAGPIGQPLGMCD